jgi:hypothetical protein
MRGLDPAGGRSPFGEAKARVSITLRNSLSKRMDCRVKPGNDAVLCSQFIAAIAAAFRRK